MPDDGDDDSLSSPRVDVVVVDDDIVALTFNDDDAEPDDDTDEAERELARFFGIVLHACDLCRNDNDKNYLVGFLEVMMILA